MTLTSAMLHLDILPSAQRQLWRELHCIPEHFTLYGGTALALRLGHRESIDFDFFAFQDIAHSALMELPMLADATVVQQQPNTLSVMVTREAPVNLSFFGLPRLFPLTAPDRAQDNGLKIAALLDLAATKAAVVQVRAEAKDYLDLNALITRGGIDLPTTLAAACALYGASFNPQNTLKALSYFEDGNVPTLPATMKEHLATAARTVNLDQLPDLNHLIATGRPS